MSVNNIYYYSEIDLKNISIFDCKLPKKRIGSIYDGGYVIIDNLEYDLFLSCGISNDVNFENSFLEKYPNLICYAFDGTIENLPINSNTNINFVKKNIGKNNTDNITNMDNYLDNYKNIMLKMDIETGENDWINGITDEQLNSIKQIVIEIHFDLFEKFTPERWNIIQRLSNTHYLVHVHGNNCVSLMSLNGVILPEVIECVYIRKSEFTEYLQQIEFTTPHEIDNPNNPGAPDLEFTIPIF